MLFTLMQLRGHSLFFYFSILCHLFSFSLCDDRFSFVPGQARPSEGSLALYEVIKFSVKE